ncbi:questin oxidase family protein [Tissierella carlieri]|uniref:Questin oxidase family protein n=1 Tax=Tissierella carlieri TaxID=689904 RepID=A0ABT1SFG4_9FIRM|nr:questin oxidase family protein [Tissierella carlieri]MBU5313327.1 questin oxidase family protein [Tissierella carlieri]MCQ4925201.1 questin oxidase family protein [Tissierella carlieri]
MSIGKLINEYGKEFSPYMRGLVNHLPMAQLALYQMTKDFEKVKSYTESYVKIVNIDLIKKEYPQCNSFEECLGKRELYESCLELVKKEIQKKNINEVIRYVLNTYSLGMSSGLFHALIRVAYAVEGLKIEEDLVDEVARSLAYYITTYREADLFKRKISGLKIIEEMDGIMNNSHIRELLESKNTMGRKIRALYDDEEYLKLGFVIDGKEEEKVKALLHILLPSFIKSGSIVILHCITGLHALIVLKEYYDNFENVLDILTTCIITHLLTQDDLSFISKKDRIIDFSWNNIISMGRESTDVHTLKLTYSCSQLSKLYDMIELKKAAKKRILMT